MVPHSEPILEGGDFAASPVGSVASPSSATQNGTQLRDSSSPGENGPLLHQKRASSSTANGSTSNGLNPRSCITCRKRKVKCDKRHPCSNCNKAAIECVFPGPGRAPRRSRKPPDTELLARLRRLEGVVQSLGKGAGEGDEPLSPLASALEGNKSAIKQEDCAQKKSNGMNLGMIGAFQPSKETKNDEPTSGMVKEFGRLVVEEGRSRYVSNKFWTSLSEEVAEMRDILDDPTEDEDDYPSPGSGSSASANHQGFIFNFSSTALSLRNYHPPVEQIPTYWSIFKSNVDPVLKLFHIPTMEQTVLTAAKDLDHISKCTEALMLSIYYAAITTLAPNECITLLGIEKQASLRKYRFAVEQAFARAGFLSTQELIVLQALLLFLTCVRRTDDSRYVWTITGLLIRLAQALGIHRDGQQFNLSPFETELRRRLWWHICTLDVRASEDHGVEPTIGEASFDTNFPLNLNDADIHPAMKEAPKEREGATELTFDLMRFSVSTAVRRLSYAPPGPTPCRIKNAALSLEDKEKMIEELHQHLEEKYLRHCDTATVPLHWVAATVARLIIAKMWLVVHHPFQRSDAGAGLPRETRDRLFQTCIEIIEFSRLLETEKTTLKWGWLFRTYVQWHALAFVLSQLCTRTLGPDVDRAWLVIDGVFDEWGGAVSSNLRGMMWKPLRKLMVKARAERANALQNRALFPLDGSIGPIMNFNSQPGPDMNGSAAEIPMFTNAMGQTYTQANEIGGTERISDGFPSFEPMIPNPTSQNGDSLSNGLDSGSFGHLPLDPPMMLEDDLNWVGWDNVVKDFDMSYI